MCKTFVFNLCKIALIKNSDIYIFAHLSAILNYANYIIIALKDVVPKINELLKTFQNTIKFSRYWTI